MMTLKAKKIQEENTIENSKYNFLKLNNTGASCYSNCIVQAILSLGANIFNTVRLLFVFFQLILNRDFIKKFFH